MKDNQNKETKKRPKDFKMKIFTRVLAAIMALLMIFAAVSTVVYYAVNNAK